MSTKKRKRYVLQFSHNHEGDTSCDTQLLKNLNDKGTNFKNKMKVKKQTEK